MKMLVMDFLVCCDSIFVNKLCVDDTQPMVLRKDQNSYVNIQMTKASWVGYVVPFYPAHCTNEGPVNPLPNPLESIGKCTVVVRLGCIAPGTQVTAVL